MSRVILALFIFGLFSSALAQERTSFFEGIVVEPEKSFMSIDVGRCRWSFMGKRIRYDREQHLQIDIERFLGLDAVPELPPGYQMGLRCIDAVDGNFDIAFGVITETGPLNMVRSGDLFNITRTDDRSVFLTFTKKIKRR